VTLFPRLSSPVRVASRTYEEARPGPTGNQVNAIALETLRVARFRFAAVRSRGERSGAAPELRAAQAQKGVAADRTLDRSLEVSHSPVVAR
jgi:hypothetical protein